MRRNRAQKISLNGRRLDYHLVESTTAKHLRVRIRPDSIEVLKPKSRSKTDVIRFLKDKEPWIVSQLDRVQKLNGVRKKIPSAGNSIMFRGEVVQIIVLQDPGAAINRVSEGNGVLTLCAGGKCNTPIRKTLINWLRRKAREEINRCLPDICGRLKRRPAKIFVMDQRTKWGNCSTNKILSFNWRLIMAPPFVMRYLITHEVTHLAVPDHSAKFWLTLKSHCPDSEQAKQWMAANGYRLFEQGLGIK